MSMLHRLLAAACAGCLSLLPVVARSAPRGPDDATLVAVEIRDPAMSDVRLATVSMPKDWSLTSSIQWDPANANVPLQVRARASSPDGSMWVDFMPEETLFWQDGRTPWQPTGSSAQGMRYASDPDAVQAIEAFVARPAEGKRPGFEAVSRRFVDPVSMGHAFARDLPATGTSAGALQVRYQRDGRAVDELFFGLLGPTRVDGGQHARMLMIVHALGAPAGQLDAALPLLGAIASSICVDSAFRQHYAVASAWQRDRSGLPPLERGPDAMIRRLADDRRYRDSLEKTLAAQRGPDPQCRVASVDRVTPYWAPIPGPYRVVWRDGDGTEHVSYDSKPDLLH